MTIKIEETKLKKLKESLDPTLNVNTLMNTLDQFITNETTNLSEKHDLTYRETYLIVLKNVIHYVGEIPEI